MLGSRYNAIGGSALPSSNGPKDAKLYLDGCLNAIKKGSQYE